MIKKIILHIGTEKTGSTSIQHALAHDREALAAKGFLYPRLFGSENHMELAVYAMEDGVNDELRQAELSKAKCQLPEYRKRLQTQIENEISEFGGDTLILSNEHCHSRLLSPKAIENLKAFLLGIAPKVEIVVYLRRQDKLAISLHSTRLKLGGQGKPFPDTAKGRPLEYFRFDSLLTRYADAFGAENLSARLFEPGRLVGEDVVSDFYATAKLPLTPASLSKSNESLSAKQWLFLEKFNELFPLIVDGKVNQMRGPIFSVIHKTCVGPAYRPARSKAEAFYAQFRESNAEVRKRFFADLDRETLFDESFASYPESADKVTLSNDEMFEFVSAIWRHARFLQQRR